MSEKADNLTRTIADVLDGIYQDITRCGTSPHHADLAKAITVAKDKAAWVGEHDPLVWSDPPAPEPIHDSEESPS